MSVRQLFPYLRVHDAERAIAFYRKWGFREMGEFRTDQDNFDMLSSHG